MTFISVLLLSLAVSLDSFTVGATYGMRHIRIPMRSILVIASCSFLMVLLVMNGGGWLMGWMTPVWGKRVGALILCLVGLWSLRNVRLALRQEWARPSLVGERQTHELSSESLEGLPNHVPQDTEMKTFGWRRKWEFQMFGYVVQVLKKPDMADMDRSGLISVSEAMLLGLALSLDAMGAGVGAVMIGFSPWLTALLIGSFSCLFLLTGLKTGFRLAAWKWIRQASFLPGALLLLLGFSKLF